MFTCTLIYQTQVISIIEVHTAKEFNPTAIEVHTAKEFCTEPVWAE